MGEIKRLIVSLPWRLGTVNCYVVDSGAGLVLIDTGSPNGRAVLVAELVRAGCRPGDLKLIVLTHGDFDHAGNAAYLREKYGAPIAMHRDDAGMAEQLAEVRAIADNAGKSGLNRTINLAKQKSDELTQRDAIVQAAQSRSEQILAQRRATAVSTGRMRSLNPGSTWCSSQARRRRP